MSFYPPKIGEKFRAPRRAGKLSEAANAVGTQASFVCGAAVRFSLRIEKDSKRIVEAKYQTSGCGFLVAAAETLSEKIAGQQLTGLHGLEQSELQRQIEGELGGFPAARRHCLNLCADALHAALANFRAAQIEEFAGEKALLCTCFGVSEETIERVVEQYSATQVEQVTDVCRAGGGCGSCRPLIQEIIDLKFGGGSDKNDEWFG
jgi:NifU-like protein